MAALVAAPLFAQNPVDFANPFAGTSGDTGQTFPGAILPFGMVTANPDTYPSSLNHDSHAGYNYLDKKIVGFSHFRMSGVGCEGIGGIFSILPFSDAPESLNPAQYAQTYDKATEVATPGYYAVKLLPSSTLAELTVSQHSVLHRYTFSPNGEKILLFDLRRGAQKVDDAVFTRISDHVFEGSIRTREMCNDPGWYRIYFHLELSTPAASVTIDKDGATQETGSAEGKSIAVQLHLPKDAPNAVQIKIGFSEIDTEHAKAQLDSEIPGWDFAAVRSGASQQWDRALGRIQVSGSSDLKKVFYTSFYHSMLLPARLSSVGGEYRGTDQKVHTSAGFRYYSSWTFWDVYRSQIPLITLLDTGMAQDMCSSLAALFAQRYDEQADGYWPVPSTRMEGAEQYLVDSMRKGICKLPDQAYTDVRNALDARVDVRREGMPYEPRHTARTLDDDYAAWAVGEWAGMIHRPGDARKYHQMAADYRTLWDPSTKFFGAKDKAGNWLPQKDPKVIDDTYLYEGSMWQYRWTVPYDLSGHAQLMGGKEQSMKTLQEFFDGDLFTIANEPDINYPYLFDYLGKPWLTQKYVHRILLEPMRNIYASHTFYPVPVIQPAFTAKPDALLPEMDDDGGTMSAWYVLSSLGIYPVTIGEPYYFLTTPIFQHAVLHLSAGKSFTIDVTGDPTRNAYIQSVTLNGKALYRDWLRDAEIRSGGTLHITVGAAPNKTWGLVPVPF
ncbi:MAG: GH92 family glycosyl hydrolase [Terracidiphilus sp.]|nr:GH92 family glycosyl hydrolase [Terracidiphilus sp.]